MDTDSVTTVKYVSTVCQHVYAITLQRNRLSMMPSFMPCQTCSNFYFTIWQFGLVIYTRGFR